MNPIDLAVMMMRDALLAGVVAGGFAIVFNTPRRLLVWCILAGMLGKATRTLMINGFVLDITLATTISATLVGFVSYLIARHIRAPSSIVALAAGIPLVPGVFAFEAMLSIIQYNTSAPEQTFALLVKTGFVLGGLSFGISVPALLFDRTKPVV